MVVKTVIYVPIRIEVREDTLDLVHVEDISTSTIGWIQDRINEQFLKESTMKRIKVTKSATLGVKPGDIGEVMTKNPWEGMSWLQQKADLPVRFPNGVETCLNRSDGDDWIEIKEEEKVSG